MTLDKTSFLKYIDEIASELDILRRVIAISDSDRANAKDLARIVQLDQPLTTKTMKLANSAYFGLDSRITTISRAITMLGFDKVRSMSSSILDADENNENSKPLPEILKYQAQVLSHSARTLAPRLSLPVEEAVCLSMISSLGQALLWRHDENYLDLISEFARRSTHERLGEEYRVYGVNSVELTIEALHQWSMPEFMIDAVSHIDDGDTSAYAVLLRACTEVSRRALKMKKTSARILTNGKFSEVDLDRIANEVSRA